MKISVDDVELFSLSEVEKKIIANDINEDLLQDDLKRRLRYIVKHKSEKCMERLKLEWMPTLKTRYPSIPTNDEELATLIFSQPEYKSKKIRDIESQQKGL